VEPAAGAPGTVGRGRPGGFGQTPTTIPMGTVGDMITVQRVVPTTLDAKSTFAFLSAFENTPTWDPGTPEVEKRTAGPVAIGSKFHAVAEFRGKRQPIDYVVTEMSDDRIQLRGENKTVISVDTIEVKPRGTGSEVHYKAEFTLKGVAKLATPFVAPMFEKLGDPAADGMRKQLDSLAATA
jgi:hypothetical protein